MWYHILLLAFRLLLQQSATLSFQATAPAPAPWAPGDSLIQKQLVRNLQTHIDQTHPEKCYLHTDRTLYRPGETIWLAAYLRDAGSLAPASESQLLNVSLHAPNGNELATRRFYLAEGKGAADFSIDPNWPGGIYKIKAWSNWMTNTRDTFFKNITLQKTVSPRLNMKMEFEKKAYGPGETAIARVDLMGLDNQPFALQPVQFTCDLNGVQHSFGNASTDANGRAYIRVPLPADLQTADGLLNVQILYRGQTEAISRAIPLVLNKIDLQFFPEGGEAVMGLPTRMAFKALNEFGKPADVSGEIIDPNGKVVASFDSYHNGMGAFDWTPQPGQTYRAKLTQPVQTAAIYTLPQALAQGATLRLQDRTDTKIRMEICATQTQKMYLAATAGDQLVHFAPLNAGPQGQSVWVPVANLPAGILRLTLLDQRRDAVAERLVFVNRNKGLSVQIQPEKSAYLPGETVRLNIEVKDRNQQPVAGSFSLAVVDETNLSFADDKQAHILSAMLLEQDLKGAVEEPNFYFDEKEPKSHQALDYLLLTQGWRRFTWKQVQNNTPVRYANAAEKMGYGGQILDMDGFTVPFKRVKLLPDGPSTLTDKNGHFMFRGIDLTQYSHIKVGPNETFLIGKNDNTNKRTGLTYLATTTGASVLKAKITDPNTGEELIGANVRVLKNNQTLKGAITDVNGEAQIPLEPGEYRLQVTYTGYITQYIPSFKVVQGYNVQAAIEMGNNGYLEEVEVVRYSPDLVRADQASGGKSISSEQLKKLPTRSVNAIVATTAGTDAIDEGKVSIKSARSNDTQYYIDGVRVQSQALAIAPLSPAHTSAELMSMEVIVYAKPLIRADDFSTGRVFNDEQIWPYSSSARRPSGNYYKTGKVNGHKYRIEISSQPFQQVREFYIPPRIPGSTEKDYRTTLYWNHGVTTDKTGKAIVEFTAGDLISNFRVTLEGVSKEGALAHAEARFYTEKSVTLEAKTPPYLLSGDTLQLRVSVRNAENYLLRGQLQIHAPAHFVALAPVQQTVEIPARSQSIFEFPLAVARVNKAMENTLHMTFTNENGVQESFQATLQIQEKGFPVRQVIGSKAPNTLFDLQLLNPVAGSISATLNAYPSTMNELFKGMERMLRQPSGCFEQVSSSNYPNLLVLDLLKSTKNAAPEIEAQALRYLEDGYKRLVNYECKKGGFDWYGRDPGHEALTAYGILEFEDMKKVFPVDQGLIDRSVQWLKTRRKGDGNWQTSAGLHNWRTDEVVGAYIAWALSEAGQTAAFKPEIEAAYKRACDTNDAYQMALMANVLYNINDARKESLIEKLLEIRQNDGSWMGKNASVVLSGGRELQIETTALAVMALLKAGQPVEPSIEFLSGCKSAYGFGNTQSTVLALRALTAYAKSTTQPTGNGSFAVIVDDQTIAQPQFATSMIKPVITPQLEQAFKSDRPKVRVQFASRETTIPYDLELNYFAHFPNNKPDVPFSFSTRLSTNRASVGQTVRMSAVLQNKSQTALASPVMVLGIPAGLSLQPWQLKQIMDRNGCDFYEIVEGMAVFYFRELAPNEQKTIDLDLKVDIAGSFEAPAARAFLYYANEQEIWAKPERIRCTP